MGSDQLQEQTAKRFAITVVFDLVEGGYDEFHRLVCLNAARSVAEEPGCYRFDVLNPDAGSGRQILLYEIYADRAAFDHHLQTSHYAEFNRKTCHLVETKSVNSFGVVEHVGTRAAASAASHTL